MLATTWSKPIATNAMIGKKIARILPETDFAASDIHTARQTSQLQPTPRRKTCQCRCPRSPWPGDRGQPLVGQRRALPAGTRRAR